jgi:hypothetical protein
MISGLRRVPPMQLVRGALVHVVQLVQVAADEDAARLVGLDAEPLEVVAGVALLRPLGYPRLAVHQ